MDIRESFSRLKKKLKYPGSKHKLDRTGADSGGETADPANPLPRPVSHVVAGDNHHQEDGVDAARRHIHSTGAPPPPDVLQPLSACGNVNNRGGGEGPGVDGGEAGQRSLQPHSDIGVVMGSGPGQGGNRTDGEKGEQAYPSPSTPSTPCIGTPDSMLTLLFELLPLTIPSDTSTIPDHVPGALHPSGNSGFGVTSAKNRLDWKSTASATAKLLLRGVRDSADAFGPLKSVTGSLCFILENCEVWPSLMCCTTHNTYDFPSE